MKLYQLLEKARSISDLGCWDHQLPSFTHVVGYSGLGHFFLHDQERDNFAVCYPFRQAYKNYGNFDSLASFETTILLDDGFSEYVLRPQHQLEIQSLIGPLENEEVYIPEPYPFLGGSEQPNTYTKGNFWVFANLVGVSHGF